MAKVVYGGLVSEVRGTLGNDVYTRNRSGGIVRTQTTNAWISTDLRDYAMDIRSLVSAAWTTDLTEAQRQAWRAFAEVANRAHTSIAQPQLSGFQWYMKLNIPLAGIFETIITDPPGDLATTQLTTLNIDSIDVSATDFTITWAPGIPAGYALRIEATDSISVGRTAWLHMTGWAHTNFTEDLTTANIWDDYVLFHPVPTADLRIGIVARLLNGNNGVYSRPFRAHATVAA